MSIVPKVRETTRVIAGVERPADGQAHPIRAARKPIWIDLDNTPHVPFFAPIISELEALGYSVIVTARDAYQTCEVADLFHLTYTRVGRHYGKSKPLKVLGTCYRAMQLLLRIAKRGGAALSVSHGSRSQILASQLLGVPSLTMVDYEFAGHSAFLKSTWLMVPDVVPKEAMGNTCHNIVSYHGIKEDVYAPSFKPDPSIRSRLDLQATDIVVVVRPPATEAHYHNPLSDSLFNATMQFLGQAPGVKIILVPRNARQGAAIRESWPDLVSTGKIRIPEHVENGLNLIWHADLVISGGGTMNREAAALGVPVYSIFRGKIGAVDRYLADDGRLTLLESPDDLPTQVVLARRQRSAARRQAGRSTLMEIVDQIVAIAESAGSGGPVKRIAHNEA
jgi:predicted glycosyltransferase